jgi:hypothetical protein
MSHTWFMKMEIAAWPIVSRHQIVEAFHPGHSGVREGPFRTLRKGKLATAGVTIVIREAGHARGRVTLFSSLNADAARLAREGHRKAAQTLARAAAKVEKSVLFVSLVEALSGRASEVIASVLDGTESPEPGLGLSVVLRDLARLTAEVRDELKGSADLREIVAGQIAELVDDNLVLAMSGGGRTMVPKWLARGAHREHVGEFLALVQERLDERQALVEAMPAISLEPTAPREELSPFGRNPLLYRVDAKDAALLAREPKPLRILVPVTIEG